MNGFSYFTLSQAKVQMKATLLGATQDLIFAALQASPCYTSEVEGTYLTENC
jgi:hypothetical protein